jgi:uncharacterized membrane protein YkoI
MNRKIISGLVAVAVIFGGALAVGAGVNDDSIGKPQEQGVKMVAVEIEKITAEKAKEIALGKQDGFVDSIELKERAGRSYYEVEIKNGNEYEFKIDAGSGEILSSSEKQDDDWVRDDKGGEKGHDKGDDNGKNDRAKITTPNKTALTSEEATAIAAKKVNGTVREIQLEEEHGRQIYKIEFTTNNGEAEVDIDAASGKVLKVEFDD